MAHSARPDINGQRNMSVMDSSNLLLEEIKTQPLLLAKYSSQVVLPSPEDFKKDREV